MSEGRAIVSVYIYMCVCSTYEVFVLNMVAIPLVLIHDGTIVDVSLLQVRSVQTYTRRLLLIFTTKELKTNSFVLIHLRVL